jgi:hypothetical protein
MAVLVEAISLAVRIDAIREKFHGGCHAFVAQCPNKTLCADSVLVRVGFMSPVDSEAYVKRLEDQGLCYQDDQRNAVDLVVIDQLRGPATRCEWVESGTIPFKGDPKRKVAIARLKGDDSTVFIAPENWVYEHSLSCSYGFVPSEHADKSLTLLTHENGFDVYLNHLTGDLNYIGRTNMLDELDV